MPALPERRLLVVDDEKEVCNFVKMFFEQRGFSVSIAHDGEEALKVALEKKPHVILLDVRMKTADDGFQIFPKLRQAVPESKILMVTAVDDEVSQFRGKALGVEDYITKPLILEYLESVVLKKVEALNPS